MSYTKKAKVESTSAVSLDRLSSLPPDIKVTILSKLNVLDAIRTTILSRAWRNMWTTSPKIIVSDLYGISDFSEGTTARSKFVTLVDLALLLHNGPLVSFSIRCLRIYHDVFDRWMHMLSRKKPRSITIKFLWGDYYKIPSSIFSVINLDYLHLKRCIIHLPQEFEGFKRLTVLNLKYFSSTDSDINNLISSCHLLNTLRLKYFEGISCLRIQAPHCSVYISPAKTEEAANWKNYLKQAFVSLTRIETLVIKRCIIGLPQEFEGFKQLTVLNLKYFSLTDRDIYKLISSCPWLNTLRLKYFEGISCLRIQAQTLQLLEVQGDFEDLHLHAPNLLYLTLGKTEAEQSDAVVGDKKNYLKQAFVSLTSIEELTISGSFLTYLSEGCLLAEFPGVFDRLRKICIEQCSWVWTEVLGACSIFWNAPNFRELEIRSFYRDEEFGYQPIWDNDQAEIEEPTLHHLVTVTISDFVGLEHEIALVGLLLRWSPALEELKIVREDGDVPNDECMFRALTKLLALPRASNKATIIVI
uniref:F-box domain-containing protein n=1 Tax=Oryza meridionalis TaxID=40149 RepID=A0A0E0CLK7_9ORYZ